MELFTSKSQNGGKYYLITKPYRIWESGSVFRIMGNIIYDCDTKSYEIFYESIPSDWIEISESDSKLNLLLPKSDRVKGYIGNNENNVKIGIPSLNQNQISKSTNCTNYLISEGYLKYPSGSIFEVNGQGFYDCDKKYNGILDYGIPKSWIQITNDDKRFLITKKKAERVSIFKMRQSESTSQMPAAGPMSLPISMKLKKEGSSSSLTSGISKRDTGSRNEYFELTVIKPISDSDFIATVYSDWTIGDRVWFRLSESYDKYDGFLQWTGKVNNVNAALVELDNVKANDPILSCQCSVDLCSKLDLHVFRPSVIVVMSCLQNCSPLHRLMQKHFSKMYGSVMDFEINSEIFSDALSLNNKEFTKSLISNCPSQCIIDLSIKMTSSPMADENKDVLLDMIQKIKKTKFSNILKLAKNCVTKEYNDLFKLVIEKCDDKNVYLENGETFLTDLIKTNAGEKVINNVLRMKQFNVNKPNKLNETPLTLACGRILPATVRILVDQKCNVDHDNYKAMDILFAAKKSALNLEQMKKVIEIIEILNSKPKAETNICMICMDRKINVVFNCGHNCCKECGDRISLCPMCSREIASKIPLYLD